MKINVTGFTSAQQKGSSQKNVIGIASLFVNLLKDQGYDVRRDSEEKCDINIVFLITPNSLNNKNMIKCLELLRNEPCIVGFDDWNIKEFYKATRRIVEEQKFSKSHPHHSKEEVLSYTDVFEKLYNGDFLVLYPAYRTGNHELLGIKGEKFCVDPSVYINKEYIEPSVCDKLVPVHASLADKWSYIKKKKYTILNVRGAKEDEVFEYYCRHRMVLSPPHYHDLSGWFRNRYSLANKAKAVIIEDENSVFGDSYKVSRKDIDEFNIDQIYEEQNRAYNHIIMDKQEISDELRKMFKRFYHVQKEK